MAWYVNDYSFVVVFVYGNVTEGLSKDSSGVLKEEQKVKNENERSKFIQVLKLAFNLRVQHACWSPAVIVFEQLAYSCVSPASVQLRRWIELQLSV